MENAEGGDLDNKIKQQRKKGYFSEERIITWFLEICQAIKYIHDKQILHRDLKPKNIFLTKNEVIKLGDFGISKVLNSMEDKTNTYAGTYLYMSPEVIKDNESYSFSCDIWSLGIILYELCTLKHPLCHLSNEWQIINFILYKNFIKIIIFLRLLFLIIIKMKIHSLLNN